MARPKNEELKADITATVERQFIKQGYNATSYRTIAEECGIGRALVQYHFPKKEKLAEAFMASLLEKSIVELGFTEADLHGNFDAIKAVGVHYFEKLLAKKGSRQFLQDILEKRDMTEEILSFNLNWALSHLDASTADKTSHVRLQRNVILHLGGFYELLYWSLRHDESIDIESELTIVVDSFAKTLAHTAQDD